MHRQCLDACILQPLSQFHDYLRIFVPSEPRLHRHRFAHCFDNALRNHHHLVRLAHHPRTGASARNLADRTSEVYVNDIASVSSGNLVRIVCHFGCFHHCFRIVSVYLDSYRCFIIRCFHLGDCLGGVADQSVRRDEFRINHICSEPFADDAERRVSDVFHRCQQHRFFSKVNISDFHAYLFLPVSRVR